ncbi:hypothetical protein EK21DRAFT_111023 [Setomelanomma holmii]|uniref:Uncharacterized protein n=1 Tax=Setomelanomma holmii TaxID=210430 RepID=A0A9P4LMY3_9PLEO|nr:hypothetical protein EK21DRAFT_111023 [Setomelanomma holmii]
METPLWPSLTLSAQLTATAVPIFGYIEPDDLRLWLAGPHRHGEPDTYRASFLVLSLFCISMVSGMVGYRIRHTDRKAVKEFALTHYLVCFLYLFATAFVASAALVETGLGLGTEHICSAAIMICIAFYVGSKIVVYLFLVERAHALRAPYMRRMRDWLWIAGTLSIALGFGALAVIAFVRGFANISPLDGKCRIGLPKQVTIPLLTYDLLINILLTLTFVHLLAPVIRSNNLNVLGCNASHFAKYLACCCVRPKDTSVDLGRGNRRVARRLKKLLWRTFFGACLVLIPTMANLIQMTILGGSESGFFCLTFCTLDVTWSCCVFHWLVISSYHDNKISHESVPKRMP